MAGKFFGQFLHWIATETVVKTLSNNRTFQRVVLRFDKFKTEVEAVAEEKAAEAAKHASKSAEAVTKQAKAKIDPLLAQAMLNAEAKTQQLREAAKAKAAGDADKAALIIGGYNVGTFFRTLIGDQSPAAAASSSDREGNREQSNKN